MMKLMMRLLVLFAMASLAVADEGTEFFERKIRPVLAAKCYACHSAQAQTVMGGLRLDTPIASVGTGRLLEAIRYNSLRIKMPPGGKLPDEQIADFEKWIAMGAPDPRADKAPMAAPSAGINIEKGRQFWAFQPVRASVAVPVVKDKAWVRTPVDAFVLSKLEAKGWKPAARTDKRSWLRRVTYDLTGLPPTPAEMDAYLSDATAEAERRVVDRLLASPHYGERWARHWLDLMRFAETNGHEFDNDKLDAWRYRDYVIRAFNEDVPYSQFVREHIAGDLLAKPRISKDGAFLESPLATGAYWFGEVLNSATDSVKSRADMVDNQIDVFGKAFLGLTVACARCHDHKFDPIPTRDYYAMAGVMHSTYVREAVVDSPARVADVKAAHARVAAINGPIARPKPASIKLREGDVLYEDFAGPSYGDWFVTGEAFAAGPVNGTVDSSGAGTRRLVGSLTSKKFKMPKLWVHIRMGGTKFEPGDKERDGIRVTLVADDHKSQTFRPNGKPGLSWVTVRMTKEIGRTSYFEIVDRSREGHLVVDSIVFSDQEQPPAVDAPEEPVAPLPQSAQLAEVEATFPESQFGLIAMEENPHDVKLHIRGSHENLGEVVPRGFLKVIAGAAPVHEGSGRLELAEWMASAKNPLTARVLVNRVWKHHFGTGLVRTTDNFGKMGEAPAHGELLDWMAAQFVAGNGTIKDLHRLMVLSSTYAMGNEPVPEARQADPRNTLLHHRPVRRLEAEAIRDAMLAVSGRLDEKLYGPSVAPHISKYQDGRGKPKPGPLDGEGRRSLYIQVRRNFLTPMFLAFDYPLPVSTTGTRGSSTVPSQALLLMNNELVAELAGAWASQAAREFPAAEARVTALYRQAFGREPEDWEKRETLAYAETAGWTDLCHVLLNSAEFVYVK